MAPNGITALRVYEGGKSDSPLRGPVPNVWECEGCPFYNPDTFKPVRGHGKRSPLMVIIGEGPGHHEARQGVPFVGPSGQLLGKAMALAGVRRSDVYITNTTLCLPRYGASGKKDTAVAKAAEHCRARLLRELKELTPAPILAVGRFAAAAMTGDKKFKITEFSGALFTPKLEHVYERERKKWKITVGERFVVPTIHPAAILRGGDGKGDSAGSHGADLEYWNLAYHIAKVKRFAEGAQAALVPEPLIEYESPKKALGLLRWMIDEIHTAGSFALDTETAPVEKSACKKCYACEGHKAIEPMHAQLTAIGLATLDSYISIAWDILPLVGRQELQKLLADPRLRKTLHNRGYDEVVCAQHGMPIAEPIDCTLLMHHNAFPGLTHKLQRVVTQFELAPAWKAEFRHGKGTMAELLPYNAVDTWMTKLVEVPLQICVKRSDAERTYQTDLAMQRIANKMQLDGIHIDLAANQTIADYLIPIIQDRRGRLIGRIRDDEFKQVFLGNLAVEQARRKRKDDSDDFYERHADRLETLEEEWEGLNLNSGDQVIALLKACGVPLIQKTKTGRSSTKKDVLEQLVSHDVVRDLLQYREHDKIYGTFVETLPRQVDRNFRTHPVWVVNKITGRFGSSPNWQNRSKGYQNWPCKCGHYAKEHLPCCHCGCEGYKQIPGTLANWRQLKRDDQGMPNLRWVATAPKGKILIGGDQAQLEARIIALLSGDPFLCGAFLRGEDIHSYFAGEIFGEAFTREPKKSPQWKLIRDVTKNMEYGYFYRASVQRIWLTAVRDGFDWLTLPMVQRAYRVFNEKMPYVAKFHQRMTGVAAREKRIRSAILGRSRWFPTGMCDPNVIANYPVQSTGADIMALGLTEFAERAPKDTKFLIQGHDSFTVEADEDKQDEIKQLMNDCFSREITMNGVTMKFIFEVEAGASLAET